MDSLNITLLNDNARTYYTGDNSHIDRGDSGYDLYYCGETLTIAPGETKMLGLGIAGELITYNHNIHGYELWPRSSIYKTGLILANSIGLIDYGYRGEIKAVVRNISNCDYIIIPGTKLFQLCMPDKRPFFVNIVDTLTSTIRGIGGFGSTN